MQLSLTIDVRYNVDECSCTDPGWVQVFLSHDGGHDNSPKATDGGEYFLFSFFGMVASCLQTQPLHYLKRRFIASLKFFCSVLPSEEATLALLVSDC